MSDVESKLGGGRVVHTVNDESEEIFYSFGYEDEDDAEEYPPDCETCGGEFWDGGTSCTCNSTAPKHCRCNDCCDACGEENHGSCEGTFVRDGSQYVCHCCNCQCERPARELDW